MKYRLKANGLITSALALYLYGEHVRLIVMICSMGVPAVVEANCLAEHGSKRSRKFICVPPYSDGPETGTDRSITQDQTFSFCIPCFYFLSKNTELEFSI